ncbi:PEP-CTERM sorting domain-containing protein [Microcystis panniformis]|uniref:Ice-binding protein C-terminal domain-containing protein n=1 Tax=Microcystis panniformis FACHB-1757 TaxID=1638788 RepID=A0A0K1S2Z4_9CHRO|nr:hypothetical protein VL20_3418 [Microcystis panniformis FACHB-1757]
MLFGGINYQYRPRFHTETRRAEIPEPTSTLSLLSLGILGAGATLKRKVKRTHSIEKEPTNVG